MPIPKEKFFEILDYLQESENFENNLRKLLYSTRKNVEFIDAATFTDCSLIDYVIYLLEDSFKDHENGWISYWIYDLNFGQRWHPHMIMQGEKDIKLQTKEDLYTLLRENFQKTLIEKRENLKKKYHIERRESYLD